MTEPYFIGINILLHTVSMMFVDFKYWMLGYIEEILVSNTSRIPGLIMHVCIVTVNLFVCSRLL